jgi:hypothetical protein
MSLILNETPLTRFSRGGGERPGVAVTYATSKGEILRAGAVTLGLTCRVRYEIDTSDHRDEVQWSLPSTDERRFNAVIRVAWKVHDPCVVTRRRVTDGFEVIKGYLLPEVRRLSRQCEIERLHDLEDQINHLVTVTPIRFPEGLEVFYIHTELSEDERTVNHAAAVRDLDRDLVVAGKRHVADRSAAISQIDLETLRRKAIEQMVKGENGLLLHHLTMHPEDTMSVVQVLQQQHQISEQARAQLLDQFRDRLLPEELDGLAELLIQHTKESIGRPASPQIGPPHVPPAIVTGSVQPTSAPPPVPAGPLRNKSTPDPWATDPQAEPGLPAQAEQRNGDGEAAGPPRHGPRDSGVKW